MRYIKGVEKEWDDFRNELEEGEASAGIVLIEDYSEVVAQQVQLLLQNASAKSEAFQYFLSSGNEQFRVPCFMLFAKGEAVSEPIRHFHILQEQSSTARQPLLAVDQLVQSVVDDSSGPRFIVIEYMTPPGRHDLIFTSQLSCSPLLQYIPILIFVHRGHHGGRQCPTERAVREMLSLLYLCGGRVRAEDWARLTDKPVGYDVDTLLFASRRIASETWVCYAHRGVAEMARDLYRDLEQDERDKLARHVMNVLPNNISYPLLAIATETNEIEAMQSKYSLKAVNVALAEPKSAVRYFESLYRLAQRTDNDVLIGVSYICYLAAPVYVDLSQALEIYQRMQQTCLRVEPTIEANFWMFLGQRLAVMNVTEAWAYAADCLCRSRAIFDDLYHAEKIKRLEWRFHLAIIAKIDALAAYKSGQGERTRHLMEFAIAELVPIVSGLSYLLDARINFGDALLRLLGDTQSAIAQYEESIGSLLNLSKKLKSRLGLSDYGILRAAQKLGDALMLVERYEEAVQIFEMLLGRLVNEPALDSKDLAQKRMNARLSLAGAYLKIKRPRSAATCYWLILHQSDWLNLRDLNETVQKLSMLRPNLHQLLQQRIDAIITIQRKMLRDVTTIQRILSDQ